MSRSNFALFEALLIHLVFILLFWIIGTLAPEFKKQPEIQEKKIKISLKEMPKKKAKISPKENEHVNTKIAPPIPKGSQLKKIVKKPAIKYDIDNLKSPIKEKKKVIEKKRESKSEIKTAPLPPKKPYIPLLESQIEPLKIIKPKYDTKKEEDLLSILSKDMSNQEVVKKRQKNRSRSSINQNIKELYGDKFGELSSGQQEYILDNQEIMRRITQEVLNRVARVNLPRDLNVNRTNTIEFYLHPNGDMSDFKFLNKSGYFILDETTKETIEYAYSRYPRPKEKTLVRYNVFYNLATY